MAKSLFALLDSSGTHCAIFKILDHFVIQVGFDTFNEIMKPVDYKDETMIAIKN